MFLKTIQGIRQGSLIDDLDRQLYELGLLVKHTGKAGELTLKLKIRPIDNMGSAIHIEDVIAVKEPELAKEKSVFFVTEAGEFVKNDPRQRNLELKSVGEEQRPAELKNVG
jgi:hypothetical protein